MPSTLAWTPEFELDHWKGIDRCGHFKTLDEKHRILAVAAFAPEHPHVVVSIGGGRWAGDLRLYTAGHNRVLIDPLADHFQNGDVPEGVEKVAAFARAIPMPSHLTDVAFCIETLDHCDDLPDLQQSIRELERIMKPGGVIFFQLPVRNVPRLGHPIAKTLIQPSEVEKLFRFSDVMLSKVSDHDDRSEVWLVLQRQEAWE